MDRRLFIALLLTGCSSASQLRETYDLASPFKASVKASRSRSQLTIAEPKTLAAFDSDRIAVKQVGGSFAYLADGAYADRLPRLLQTRLVHVFENSNRLASVGRPGDRMSSDFQLVIDIREFYLDIEDSNTVKIEISVKLMNDKTGRIVDAEFFSGSNIALSASSSAVAKAFEEALAVILTMIVQWAVKKLP
jgi:cholesterol transport system auxiliary component